MASSVSSQSQRQLYVTGTPTIGNVLTCADNSGRAVWAPGGGGGSSSTSNIFEWATYLVSPDYTQFDEFLPPGTKTYTDVQTAIDAASADYLAAGNGRRRLVLIRPGQYSASNVDFELKEGVDLRGAEATPSARVYQIELDSPANTFPVVLRDRLRVTGSNVVFIENIGVQDSSRAALSIDTDARVTCTSCFFEGEAVGAITMAAGTADRSLTLNNCIVTNTDSTSAVAVYVTGTGPSQHSLVAFDCSFRNGFDFQLTGEVNVLASFNSCIFNCASACPMRVSYDNTAGSAGAEVRFQACIILQTSMELLSANAAGPRVQYGLSGCILSGVGLSASHASNDVNTGNTVQLLTSSMSGTQNITLIASQLLVFESFVFCAPNIVVDVTNGGFQLSSSQWVQQVTNTNVGAPLTLTNTEFGMRNALLAGIYNEEDIGGSTAFVTVKDSNQTTTPTAHVTIRNSSIILLKKGTLWTYQKTALDVVNNTTYIEVVNSSVENGTVNLVTSDYVILDGSTFRGNRISFTSAPSTFTVTADGASNGLHVSQCSFLEFSVVTVTSSNILNTILAWFQNCTFDVSDGGGGILVCATTVSEMDFYECAMDKFLVNLGAADMQEVTFRNCTVKQFSIAPADNTVMRVGIQNCTIGLDVNWGSNPNSPNPLSQYLRLAGNVINAYRLQPNGIKVINNFLNGNPWTIETVGNTVFSSGDAIPWFSCAGASLPITYLTWNSRGNTYIGAPTTLAELPAATALIGGTI